MLRSARDGGNVHRCHGCHKWFRWNGELCKYTRHGASGIGSVVGGFIPISTKVFFWTPIQKNDISHGVKPHFGLLGDLFTVVINHLPTEMILQVVKRSSFINPSEKCGQVNLDQKISLKAPPRYNRYPWLLHWVDEFIPYGKDSVIILLIFGMTH